MINSYMKYIMVILGLAIGLATVEGGPGKKGPKKGRGKPSPGKVEEAKKKFNSAKKKRSKSQEGARKRGLSGRLGKLVRSDEKIIKLKKDFAAAEKKLKGNFDRKQLKDATDEQRAALREKAKASRKEWEQAMRAHRTELGKRIKEIRNEFKNKRDKVIDANKTGE